jgi:rhodanese-related sulfurtransferase
MVTSHAICLLTAAGLLLAVPPAGAEVVAPDEIAGVVKVDAEGLIGLAQRSRPVLIDARIAVDRKQGYIEDSVSLPDVETDCASLKTVAPDPATPLLFYCNGPKCGRSVVAVRIALQCGYRELYWFRGGFEEWQLKAYPYLKD